MYPTTVTDSPAFTSTAVSASAAAAAAALTTMKRRTPTPMRQPPPRRRKPSLKSSMSSSNRVRVAADDCDDNPSKRQQQQRRRSGGPIKKRKIVVDIVAVPPPPNRPRVRFSEEVMPYKARVFKTPLPPGSTWLKEKDLTKIREGVFSTLDFLRRRRDAGYDVAAVDDESSGLGAHQRRRHCARGLEDCSVDHKGSPRASTIHRRQNAIRAVLFEQELQRRRLRLLRTTAEEDGDDDASSSSPLRVVGVPDPRELARVSARQTASNVREAISAGRVDSERALAIYSERPPQQQKRHLYPPAMTIPPPVAAKASRTTWGFSAPIRSPPPPMALRYSPLPPPPSGEQHPDRPAHRRLVSA